MQPQSVRSRPPHGHCPRTLVIDPGHGRQDIHNVAMGTTKRRTLSKCRCNIASYAPDRPTLNRQYALPQRPRLHVLPLLYSVAAGRGTCANQLSRHSKSVAVYVSPPSSLSSARWKRERGQPRRRGNLHKIRTPHTAYCKSSRAMRHHASLTATCRVGDAPCVNSSKVPARRGGV